MLGRAARKLRSTRRTSSGGAGAPPPPTETRLAVSRRAKSGHSSRSQDCVGTPTKWVTRSRSISSSARAGSHLCIITSLQPVAKQESITGTQPVTWKSGTTRMKLVGQAWLFGGPSPIAALIAARHAKASSAESTARCVETAPFG